MSGACASRKHVGRPLLGPAHEMGWVGQETGGRRPTSTKKSILVLVPCSPDRGGYGSSGKLSWKSAQIWCGQPECQSTLMLQGPGGGYGKGSNRADPARQGKVIASAPSHTKK